MRSDSTGMMNTDILFAMTGDLYLNSRALKQVRSLSEAGWRVHVLALPGEANTVNLPPSVSVAYIRPGHRHGRKFFRDVHREMLDAARGVAASCYHASDLYALPAMAQAAAAQAAAYTYDSRELYAHVAATVGRPWVRWYWSYVEERYIRSAAAVFTVSKKIAQHLAATYGIRQPLLIRNVPPRFDGRRSDRLARLIPVDPAEPIILHLGQMRHARGCEALVRAMARVERGTLVFLGYGDQRERLIDLTLELGLSDRVVFRDPVPPDEVLDATTGATVGVTLLEDTCLNHRYALPNKLFDYLAAGVPVLASDLPEIRSVVQGYNVGKTVDPADVDAVQRTLNEMISSVNERAVWAANARRLCETFNWEKASQRFVRAFRGVMTSPSQGKNDTGPTRLDQPTE